MNPATINQSSRLITDAIYKYEYFENQDKQEREAITMDEFHRKEVLKQLEESANRTKELEKLISSSKEQEELRNKMASERDKYYKDLEQTHLWDPLKNHWYWGEYASVTPTPGPSQAPKNNDFNLDNLDSDNVVKVELSQDYTRIGRSGNHKVLEGTPINSGCVYRAPFREYCYDQKNDKLIPNDKRYVTDSNVLNLEQKCLDNNNNNTEEAAFNQKFKEKVEMKEGFENILDPKLMQIYTKTLSPQDDSGEKFISNFTYWHCLILIIIFFLLFR
uniref:Uncharacterized protein n=1 Tax=viral metagenome TaxID=1070528 RepID=A0A6C0E7T1_9ZZZZ